jgi:hypothetical protein
MRPSQWVPPESHQSLYVQQGVKVRHVAPGGRQQLQVNGLRVESWLHFGTHRLHMYSWSGGQPQYPPF